MSYASLLACCSWLTWRRHEARYQNCMMADEMMASLRCAKETYYHIFCSQIQTRTSNTKYERHHSMSLSTRALNRSIKMLNSTLATEDFSADVRDPRSVMPCAIQLALLSLATLLLPILSAVMILANLTMDISFNDVSRRCMLWILVPLAAAIMLRLRRMLPFVKSMVTKSKKTMSEIPLLSTIAPPLLVLALLPVALSKLEPNYQ